MHTTCYGDSFLLQREKGEKSIGDSFAIQSNSLNVAPQQADQRKGETRNHPPKNAGRKLFVHPKEEKENEKCRAIALQPVLFLDPNSTSIPSILQYPINNRLTSPP